MSHERELCAPPQASRRSRPLARETGGAESVERDLPLRFRERALAIAIGRHADCLGEPVLTIATERFLRVSDLMSSPVRTLPADARIEDAKLVLAKERVSALAVVTPHGKLVGVVSTTDVCDPRHDDPNAPVETAMTRVLYAVRPEDPATAAVRLMVREGIHRVLVVTEGGGLVGIVTSMDVLRSIAERSVDDPTELVRVGR